MKRIIILFVAIGPYMFSSAQGDVTNTGIIFLTGNTDTLFITGSFSNNNTASFVNNGNVIIKGNVTNVQATDLTGSGTITLTGSSAQMLNASSAFRNLILSKSAGNTSLLSDIRVNGNLQFISGNINTGLSSVIIPSSGTISGAAQNTGWINGNLQKAVPAGAVTRVFETGDALIYAPVQLTFPSVSIAGNIMASTTGTEHPNIGISMINPAKSVNRHWWITNIGTSFNSYNAIFNFNPTDVDAGSNTSVFGVGLFDGTNWSMLGTSLRNATNIRAGGFTTFGSFAIGETFVVVPVTFTDIKAFKKQADIEVQWFVNNEMNIASYEIERSCDGSYFEKIDNVPSNGIEAYHIIDRKPLAGNNFYRIRSIDHRGTGNYSPVVNVKMEAAGSMIIYPNPVSGSKASIQLRELPAGYYKLQMFHSTGMNVKNIFLNHPGGTSDHIITLGNYFAPGKYEIILTGSGNRIVASLIKK